MGIPPAAMSELGGLTVACRDFGPVPTQRRAPALFQRKAPLRGGGHPGDVSPEGGVVMSGRGHNHLAIQWAGFFQNKHVHVGS